MFLNMTLIFVYLSRQYGYRANLGRLKIQERGYQRATLQKRLAEGMPLYVALKLSISDENATAMYGEKYDTQISDYL